MGGHTYAQAGTFSITTTVRDDEGQSVSDTSLATVSAPSIVAQGVPIAARPRKAFSGTVATFTDPVPAAASSFSVQIRWGDGTTSSGVVVASGNSPAGAAFTVFGSHTFARRKKYAGAVDIVENGGSQVLVPIVATVGPARRSTKVAAVATGQGKNGGARGHLLGANHPGGPSSSFRSGALKQAAALRTIPLAASSVAIPKHGLTTSGRRRNP